MYLPSKTNSDWWQIHKTSCCFFHIYFCNNKHTSFSIYLIIKWTFILPQAHSSYSLPIITPLHFSSLHCTITFLSKSRTNHQLFSHANLIPHPISLTCHDGNRTQSPYVLHSTWTLCYPPKFYFSKSSLPHQTDSWECGHRLTKSQQHYLQNWKKVIDHRGSETHKD